MFVFHYNITRKRDERRMGRGRGEERSVVQRARREEFMWMWEKYTTHPFFFYYRGEAGAPHNHCLIITSMEGRCVLGMQRRRERKQERKIKRVKKGGNCRRKTRK